MSCETCGSTENLVEHHISYDPEVKQTLCSRCHGRLHWEKWVLDPLLEIKELRTENVETEVPIKTNRPPRLDELMENAISGRCACAVCHRLREEYIKRLREEVK